jgi:hypothetical protein
MRIHAREGGLLLAQLRFLTNTGIPCPHVKWRFEQLTHDVDSRVDTLAKSVNLDGKINIFAADVRWIAAWLHCVGAQTQVRR